MVRTTSCERSRCCRACWSVSALDGDDEVAAGVEVASVHARVVRTLLERFAGAQLELNVIRALRHLDGIAAVGRGRRFVVGVAGDLGDCDLAAGEGDRPVAGADGPGDRPAGG